MDSSLTISWHDPAELAAAGRTMSGLEFLCAIRDGKLPAPPMAQLLGFRLIDVEPGYVVFEVTPGERFALMIETLFGLARLGHTNAKGLPNPLQLAVFAREFSDVIVLRKPPLPIQRAMFGLIAPIAHRRGYRATYPQISRTVLAPRA